MKKLLCLALFCKISVSLLATTGFETGYTFTNVSMNDGLLPGSNVVAILNDGSQIWFGTRSGVVAFSEFGKKHWNYSVTSHDSICMDSSGAVWLTTDNGTFIYNRLTEDLETVTDRKGYYCCAVGDEVCIYRQHHLLFYPAGGGGAVRIVELESNLDIMSMVTLPDGSIIMGNCTGSLYRYFPDGGGLQLFCEKTSPNVRRIRYYDGVIYTLSYGGGIFRFSLDGTFLGRIEGINTDYITDLALFDGRLWICTDGDGIYITDPSTEDFSLLRHIQGDSGSFPTNALTTLYPDGKYGLWAGTVRYGACNISKRYIHTFSDAMMGSTHGLSEKCVVSISTDREGCCWIGTDGQGINRFNPKTRAFRQYPSTFGYSVPGICRYDDRHLLIEIFNKGLYLFDTVTANLSPFTLISKSSALFNNGEYPVILSPRPDLVFILSSHSYVHNPQTGSVCELTDDQGRLFQGNAPLVWYSDGFLLVSENNNVRINRYDDYVIHDLCRVPHGNVTALSYDPIHSRIWIVVDRNEIGYFSFDPASEQIPQYTRLDDLNITNVSTLTSDSQGHLWVTTGSAIYMLEQDSKTVKRFTNYDGYERNDILVGIPSISDAGVVYVAGSSGLVMVNTDIADASGISEPPVISLSEIETKDGSIPAQSQDAGKAIRIPWNKGLLKLYFSISGLHFQEEPIIKYVISGESESTITTPNRVLDLSALSPGHYTISTECLWSGSSQSDDTNFRLRILPPWYRSLPFNIALVFIALLGVIYFTFRYARKYASHTGHVSESDRVFLRHFCEYVALHLDQNLSYEALTKELGVSRTSLYEKVKSLTGYSLNDYVKKIRVEKAMSLLKNSELNINEISDALGFSYPRYFSSVFKEVTGESPTQYRLKHHKNN